MTVTVEAKRGDVIFSNGLKIKVTKTPEWSDYYKHYYATGYRWIKTKKKFSSVSVIHFIGTHYEIVNE